VNHIHGAIYIKKRRRGGLVTAEGKDKYLLVIVCTFSEWIVVFPIQIERAQKVVCALLKDIIPRYGISISIGSDNEPAFVRKVVK
jgi:hypothetical protein